jgi:hypothetical protein
VTKFFLNAERTISSASLVFHRANQHFVEQFWIWKSRLGLGLAGLSTFYSTVQHKHSSTLVTELPAEYQQQMHTRYFLSSEEEPTVKVNTIYTYNILSKVVSFMLALYLSKISVHLANL